MAVPDYTFKIKDISDSLGSNNVTVDEDDVDNQAQPSLVWERIFENL